MPLEFKRALSARRSVFRNAFCLERILPFRVLGRSSAFLAVLVLGCVILAPFGRAASFESLFGDGITAYRAGDFTAAARVFRQSAALRPGSGTLQNLGNAEWQCGRTGAAVLAWEQALWLDPYNQAAHGNLRFARRIAQLEAPELTWYEVISTWLPVNWWAWITGGSFWLAIAMVMLPGILKQRKAAWHQAVAALGLMIFLLSVPAHFGVHTRSHLGFILEKGTPLRLTPTAEAQVVTRLAAGEPVRWERARGRYLLIRTNHSTGWVERTQLGVTGTL